jgi:hypothetical protein
LLVKALNNLTEVAVMTPSMMTHLPFLAILMNVWLSLWSNLRRNCWMIVGKVMAAVWQGLTADLTDRDESTTGELTVGFRDLADIALDGLVQ